jgi:hypothetical protein
MTMSTSFGARVRWWRAHRGLSQLDLAGAAGTTQRHVSFLEWVLPARELPTSPPCHTHVQYRDTSRHF